MIVLELQLRLFRFRAWNFEAKEMVEDWFPIENNESLLSKKVIDLKEIIDANGLHIMQFSGLYDRNGREIYEGDILLAREEGMDDELFSIVFDNGCFCLKDYPENQTEVLYRNWYSRVKGLNPQDIDTLFDVIGHIYESEDTVKERIAKEYASE